MWRDAVLVAGQGPPHRGPLPGGAVPGGPRSASWPWSCSPSPSAPTGPSWPRGAPGLFWVAVLFCTVLAVQRSVSVESADGARDGLRLSGLDPAGLFLGKSAAVAAQLVVLEVVLAAGVVLLYGAHGSRCPGCIVVLVPARHRRPGRHRHPLRRAVGRAPGPRDAAALPVPAHRRPGAAGRDPDLAGRPGRGDRRRTGPRGSASWSSSTPSTWPSASSSTAPSRSRHESDPTIVPAPACPAPPVPSRPAPAGPPGSSGSPPLVATALTVWLGLWVTPPDQTQGDLVRLVYIHPGVAWVALYLAFGLAAVASLLYLWPRTRSPVLGPAGRRRGRGGRGVQRVHADLRLDLGQAHLGGVVGVGRPADQHRRAAGALPRLPGPAPGAGRARGPGQAQSPSWPCSPRWTSPSSTSRCCGGRPSTRGPPCSTPTSRPPSTARWPGPCCSASWP